jgi:hypothetical protein
MSAGFTNKDRKLHDTFCFISMGIICVVFFSSPGLYAMWAIAINFRLSSVIRPSTFHILIFSSETTGSIATNIWWNGPWMDPFQNCVRWFRFPNKMAAKLKIEKGMTFKKNLLWNYRANLNQTLLKWSLGGPLPKLCPALQIAHQDGCHSRT